MSSGNHTSPSAFKLFIRQWRLRSLDKKPEEAGLSVCTSSLALAFSPRPSSPSNYSNSDWSSSSKSSTSLSDSSVSSSSLLDSVSPARLGSSVGVMKLTAASILSWMAAVTAAVITSPAIWLTKSRALVDWSWGSCLDLIGSWSRVGGEARPRLRSSSSSPLVVVPLSSEGNSGRPPMNGSSLSKSDQSGPDTKRKKHQLPKYARHKVALGVSQKSVKWNLPSEFSVCGVCPSDRLKVPLSVHVTSDTSVSDTDISLHTVESSWARETHVRFYSANPDLSW